MNYKTKPLFQRAGGSAGWAPAHMSFRAASLLSVFAIAITGSVLMFSSHAAPFSATIEPESGTLLNGVSRVNDANASAGQAVKFSSGNVSDTTCPPYPAFPDENCTGWQHTGVSLKAVPTQITSGVGWHWEGAPFNYVMIDANNAVVDGVDVNGCVYVANDGAVNTATIKRSRITCGADYAIRLADFNANTAISVIDTEFVSGAVQQKGNGFHWLRVNAHNFTGKAAMLGSNAIVEDSYIHDNECTPPDHQSGIGTNGGSDNTIMRHNNVDLTPSDCTSGGISNYTDFGSFSNVIIEKNLINSAGYCLKAGLAATGPTGTNVQVIDNVFGRKYFSECGYYGPVSNWITGSPGNVWSGNIWGGGAAATSSHAIGDLVTP